jgi:PAS domain S-box-containing protein
MIETVHPDDREHYARSYESQMQDGRHEVEYRIVRNDGETRFIYETGTVEFDDQGKVSAAIGLLQDVTQRKLHQQALENREALAQQVEAITDIGHFIFDLVNETYIYISPGFARIHGVSVDEYMSMVNSRDDDIEDVHPDDYEALVAVYQRHKDEGEEFSVEYRIYRSDGELRWIREKGTSVRSASGEVIQSIGVLQDITEQTRIEQRLREARDSLEAMVKSRTRKLAAMVKQLEGEPSPSPGAAARWRSSCFSTSTASSRSTMTTVTSMATAC